MEGFELRGPTSRAGVWVGRRIRATTAGEVVNEVADRVGCRFGEVDELDACSIEHVLAMKMAYRGMNDAALDDHDVIAQRHAKIVQCADLKRHGRDDLGTSQRELRDPHRLDDGDASREIILKVDPGDEAPIPRHVARL